MVKRRAHDNDRINGMPIDILIIVMFVCRRGEKLGNMKSSFVWLACVVLSASCFFEKDMQVERVNVRLVKIDTVYRPGETLKMLTWKTDRRLEYFSMEPIESPQMNIGYTTVMLMRK